MESHDTNRLRYFSSNLTYMVIKSKIFIKCKPSNLTVETFMRIESRIVMLYRFFWLKITIYKVLLTLRESLFSVVLESVIDYYLVQVWKIMGYQTEVSVCWFSLRKTNN